MTVPTERNAYLQIVVPQAHAWMLRAAAVERRITLRRLLMDIITDWLDQHAEETR